MSQILLTSNKLKSFKVKQYQPQYRRVLRKKVSTNSYYSLNDVSGPKSSKQKHFLHLDDFSKDEILQMLDYAEIAKREHYNRHKSNKPFKPFENYSMTMLFLKPSLRTRLSFDCGFQYLGGNVVSPSASSVQLGDREPIKDVARVFSGFTDVVMVRVFSHDDLMDLAKFSDIPVINGLTDYNHPCQIMADAMTIKEVKGKIEGVRIAYVGEGNNIVNSWLRLACVVPLDFLCVCPEGYGPDEETIKMVESKGISKVQILHDPKQAIDDTVDVIYTDVHTSMGDKGESQEKNQQRQKAFESFIVNEELMGQANKDAIFMHCLPANRGQECTDGVVEAPNSVVFQQAENRMHAQNGILMYCLGCQI